MGKINLQAVGEENIESILKLKVNESQRSFVATPCQSLAYAYVKREWTEPYGIYCDEELVGYVSIIFDIEDRMYNIWHFLIDQKFQGKGYGKEALREILKAIKKEAIGKTDKIALGVEPENKAAKNLYQSVGFVETGEVDDGEDVMIYKIK